MRIPKYLAILNASMIDGLYLPFSKDPIVWRDTLSAAASSSCRIPCCLRSSSKRFFIHLSPEQLVLLSILTCFLKLLCPCRNQHLADTAVLLRAYLDTAHACNTSVVIRTHGHIRRDRAHRTLRSTNFAFRTGPA